MKFLGLSISYDEMMRIDTRLAEKVIQEASECRVTVGQSNKPRIILHGAMDNFDHDEEIFSGKDSSHDKIIMLLQNTDSKVETSNHNNCNFCKIPENQPFSYK